MVEARQGFVESLEVCEHGPALVQGNEIAGLQRNDPIERCERLLEATEPKAADSPAIDEIRIVGLERGRFFEGSESLRIPSRHGKKICVIGEKVDVDRHDREGALHETDGLLVTSLRGFDHPQIMQSMKVSLIVPDEVPIGLGGGGNIARLMKRHCVSQSVVPAAVLGGFVSTHRDYMRAASTPLSIGCGFRSCHGVRMVSRHVAERSWAPLAPRLA